MGWTTAKWRHTGRRCQEHWRARSASKLCRESWRRSRRRSELESALARGKLRPGLATTHLHTQPHMGERFRSCLVRSSSSAC